MERNFKSRSGWPNVRYANRMVDVWIMAATPARRDWLLHSVSLDPSIRVAGAASTFPFLRSLMSEASADVAVIDLQSTRESSIVRDWVLELMDLVAIVLLSSESDPGIFNRILHAGTGGMLQTDASPEQIVHAIRGVRLDDRWLVTPQRPGEDPRAESLTPRESEVLRWSPTAWATKIARASTSRNTRLNFISDRFWKTGRIVSN